MGRYTLEPISLENVQTYPLAGRKSKVTVREFGRPVGRGASVRELIESLPRILAGNDLREVIAAIRKARGPVRPGQAPRRTILWGLGGHVIGDAAGANYDGEF